MPKSRYNVGSTKKKGATAARRNGSTTSVGLCSVRRFLLNLGLVMMGFCFVYFRSQTDRLLGSIKITLKDTMATTTTIGTTTASTEAYASKYEQQHESTVCISQEEIDKSSLLTANVPLEKEDPGTFARSDPHDNSAKGDTAPTLRKDYNSGNDIACRVLVANHPDYHYELLESVVLKYPLPWDDMPCDFTKSNVVVFDIAMTLHAEKAKELPTYKAYYYSYLQGVPRRRMVAESKRNTTNTKYENVMAIIGDVGSPWEMEKYEGIYAAQIAVSCGTIDPKGFVNRSPFHFCVQHVSCDISETFCDDNTRKRSCWLNPMHNQTCYFMADIFPMFPDSERCQQPQNNKNNDKIRLCTIGTAKSHARLASVFGADANYYRQHVELHLHHRFGMIQEYVINKVDDFVFIANQSSFIGFQQSVSKCDILIPLLFPEAGGLGYFRYNPKSMKLSGSLSQLIGYHLPSVMHKDIYDSYKDVLTAPATTHESTEESLDKALKQMIQTVAQNRKRACNHSPNIIHGKKCLPTPPLRPELQSQLVASAKQTSSQSDTKTTPPLPPPPQDNNDKPAVSLSIPPKEDTANIQKPPIRSWMSRDALIRPQEERQYVWEKEKREQQKGNDKNAQLRQEFREKVLESANSPANQALQLKAGKLLREAMTKFTAPGYEPVMDEKKDPVFDEIIVAVDLEAHLMEPGDGNGQSKKALVGETLFGKLDGDCVIYGAGIAYETSFEVTMAQKNTGCAVHSFDCTMNDVDALTRFIDYQKDIVNLAFHPWCVGEEDAVDQDVLKKSNVYDMSKFSSNMVRLEEIMERLHHEEVDLLKFDIEGFEWKLFDSILQSTEHLPRQMAFELHTRHANPGYVPPHLVKEKGREAVVALFDRLYQLGYRTVSKELNFGDFRCAEFVVYRFYDGDENL
ncbi:Methyltransferase-like protein 24 [Seminavis robusta]|uniref:Methyltransferase-like protein 24 n=1 Tax=Seminavis robusta TaxID=568900 RepID=A0A9N8DVM1_9STRA|nr:Methyltransferase-like protein 24 [Seminavis robusta]|eukprot:Sro406_g136360.1 Methyltransferase-like protein 24 (911) ;mRNA; r:15346-18367